MNEGPALRPSVAVGEALREVARDILAEARAAIDNPEKSDAEAVHDFRRAMKRWRALLRLLEPFLGADARRLRDEARDLARALTGARNAQSALDALADLEKHGLALSARSIAELRRRLDEIRQAAETSLNGDMRPRLGSALDQAAAVVERWPLHTLTFEDAAEQLTRFYRRARRLMPAHWPAAQAEELHELRKYVVIHRYQIDIIEPLVAPVREDVERRGAAAARSARQAPGPDRAGKPHRTSPAARALALTPRARDRRAQGRACRGRRPHRRAPVRRKAERDAPAARGNVGGGSLKRALRTQRPYGRTAHC